MVKVAVISGSNKGIGLAIVRSLCKTFDGEVYITSRDEKRGLEAVKLLEGEGLSPKYHQLDINDDKSIEKLREYLISSYQGIDVLVNNAAIAFKSADTTPFGEQAVVTMKTNYHSLVKVCDLLIPIMKPGGRIVTVSSMGSFMSLKKCSEENQKFFRSANITVEELTEKLNDFVKNAQNGTNIQAGYSDSAYGMSKIGATVLTRIWAKRLEKEEKEDIVINACCPGWIRTDMGGPKASKLPDEGAITPVYLATLPANIKDMNGKFLSNKTVKVW